MLQQRHLLAVAIATVVLPAVGGYGLVLAGLVDPSWMGNVASAGFCVGLGLLIASPFIPTIDREPDRLDRAMRSSKLWTTAVLLATVFWELPFVALSHGPIREATAQDHGVWLWWLYGVADSGYLNAHPVNIAFEGSMVALVPLEILALSAFRSNNNRRAAIMTVIAASCQFYAVSLYYAVCVLDGFQYISRDVADLVLKFVGLNSFWIIGPAVQLWACGRYLRREGMGVESTRATEGSGPEIGAAAYSDNPVH